MFALSQVTLSLRGLAYPSAHLKRLLGSSFMHLERLGAAFVKRRCW